MRTLIWLLTIVAVGLWSAIAWAAHVLIGIGGNLASSNADLLPGAPELAEWASWFAVLGTGAGEWLVIAIWAVVSAVIIAIGFLVSRLIPAGQAKPPLT